MADVDQDATQGAHGPAIAGKHKGGAHRTQIIMICSVVGVGLAFMTLRKTGSSTAAATTDPAAVAGLAGSGTVSGFDQAAADGLNAQLAQQSQELAQLTNVLNGLPQAIQNVIPGPAPTPKPTPTPPPHPAPHPAPHKGGPPVKPTPRPAPHNPAPHLSPYVVKSGDNLSEIAARYPSPNITASSLMRLNGLHSSVIHPGQTLRIG